MPEKVSGLRITAIDKSTSGYVKSSKEKKLLFIWNRIENKLVWKHLVLECYQRIPIQHCMIPCGVYKFIGAMYFNLEVLNAVNSSSFSQRIS